MNKSELVTPQHLNRKAMIYIRQSSPNQVLTNQESLRLQYALKGRAEDLGWQPENIEVVDSDLGLSGSSAKNREGFKDVLAKVTLGHVGIILSYEVTRLSRNCTDWYPLLDICGYKNCLIGDRDGIYDPGTPNGRLLLGLKGQISELELHTIHARLTAGILSQASRGDLALKLPTGLVRLANGKVEKDPNREVQHRIELIFEKFLQFKSAGKVLRYFIDQNLLIPRREGYDGNIWRKPTISAILSILKNPAYAGTFVYGRTRWTRKTPSSSKNSMKRLPMHEWRIRVDNKFPPYVDWKTFERIQLIIKENYAEYLNNNTKGIPRAGSALLQGIVYCGACSHKMSVQYKVCTRYLCTQLKHQYGGPACQFIPSDPVDAKVVEFFFQAIMPVELDLYSKVMQQRQKEDDKLKRAQKEQLERLRYEVTLAQRQYNLVDPDNRLVASELEQKWEVALKTFKQAEAEFNQRDQTIANIPPLSPELKAAFGGIGEKLPELWSQPILTRDKKKALLRSLIEKVVIHRTARDIVHIRIIWRGGDSTTFDISIPVKSFSELSNFKEMEEKVLTLTREGKSDKQIAEQLTTMGFRSPLKSYVPPSTVQIIRLKHHLFQSGHQSHPREANGFYTVPQLAKLIGVQPHWLYDRINSGSIDIKRRSKNNGYLFKKDALNIANIKKLKNGELKKVHCS